MSEKERIVLDKEQAADFGQLLLDMVTSHLEPEIEHDAEGLIDSFKMSDGYIRVWQRLKVELAAVTAQRDALLAACREARDEIKWWIKEHPCCERHADETLAQLRAAIALTKGDE